MTKTPYPPRQGSASPSAGIAKCGNENFQSISLTLWRLQNLHEALTEQASQLFATAAEVEAKAAHLTKRLQSRQKKVNLPPLALEADFEDMELRLEAFGARIKSYRQQMTAGPITQKRLDDMATRTSELEEKLRRFKTRFTSANERLVKESARESASIWTPHLSGPEKHDNVVRFSAPAFFANKPFKKFQGTTRQPKKLFSLASKLKSEISKRAGFEDRESQATVIPFPSDKKD